MRIDEGETITAFQVLKSHRLKKGRFAGPGLPDDVDMRKAILVFDAEQAIIISKISPTYVCDATALHHWRVLSARPDTAGETDFCQSTTNLAALLVEHE